MLSPLIVKVYEPRSPNIYEMAAYCVAGSRTKLECCHMAPKGCTGSIFIARKYIVCAFLHLEEVVDGRRGIVRMGLCPRYRGLSRVHVAGTSCGLPAMDLELHFLPDRVIPVTHCDTGDSVVGRLIIALQRFRHMSVPLMLESTQF